MPTLLPDQDRPEALTGAPADLLEMYAYWQRKRAGRSMPTRADIDPGEIRRLLPGVLLVDVVHRPGTPMDFIYRLVGTREVEMRGHDPTGKRVADAFYGESADEVTACYRQVAEQGRPYLDDDCFHLPEQEWSPTASIYLPLSQDGQLVTMVLVYSSIRWIAGGWKPDRSR
jgi:hypothetical protein